MASFILAYFIVQKEGESLFLSRLLEYSMAPTRYLFMGSPNYLSFKERVSPLRHSSRCWGRIVGFTANTRCATKKYLGKDNAHNGIQVRYAAKHGTCIFRRPLASAMIFGVWCCTSAY